MNRLALVVVVAVLLSGCNALGSGAETPADTVTPMPVPDVESANAPTEDGGGCLVPEPAAAPQSPPGEPADPVTVGSPDDELEGSTLVARHVSALANHSYHLRAGDVTEVWSMPGAAAFTYQGISLGVDSPWAYAVGGKLYTLRPWEGKLVFREQPYTEQTRRRMAPDLAGEEWLDRRLGWINYTAVGTRSVNGTELVVFRDTLDRAVLHGPGPQASSLVRVNSTVLVDRRGVIRRVRHVEHIEYDSDLPTRTAVSTFSVDRLGTASLHRPVAFCIDEPDAVLTATPAPVGGGVDPRNKSTGRTVRTRWVTETPPPATNRTASGTVAQRAD